MLTSIAILVVFGILLLVLETFLPGLIAGILGTLSLIAAVWLSLTASELDTWTGTQRTALVITIIAFTIAILFIWLRWFAVKFFRRGFMLEKAIEGTSDTTPQAAPGTFGVAITELRPLGRAEIDGRRYEVRCQTGHAPAGARVEVVSHEFGSLIVRTV